MEQKSHQQSQMYFAEGRYLSEELSRILNDVNGALTRCFAFFMQGQLKQAQSNLPVYTEQNEENVEPLMHIANAIIQYNEGKIFNALNHLKKVVNINPNCPADIWLGIGILYFKLKNFIKAKFSLEHVIELEPNNSMALTALGITEIQLNPSNLE